MEQRGASIQKSNKPQPEGKESAKLEYVVNPELLAENYRISPETIQRARVNPVNFNRADMLPLQRTVGNQAVQRLLAVRAAGLIQREGVATASPTTAEVEQKMNAALQRSALGQKALAVRAEYNIPLEWVDSGTAGYDEEHNKCFINRTMDPNEIASYFVHEMHHANEFLSGRSKAVKDYNDDQEEEYIQRMVNEEITGTFLQFETMIEIGASPSGMSTMGALFPQYKRVRQHWIDEHLKTNPEDREGAVKAGKQKGRALITFWIRGAGGKDWPKLAANQLESYEMYYRRLFRQSRAKTGSPPSGGHTH